MNQRFAVMSDTEFMLRIIVVTFIDRVSEKNNGGIKSYGAKSVIFGHLRAFWGIFRPKRALGDVTRIINQGQRY